MKTLITTLIVVTLLVPALALAWGENVIGLYTTENPTGDDMESSLMTGVPGTYDIYLVCTNAWNWTLDQQMSNIGGFELELILPDTGDWVFNGITLPLGVLDLNAAPGSFYCAGLIPAPGGTATLATINLLTFDPTVGDIYMEPYFAAPSIEGSMAITDADDEFSLAGASPSSGEYAMPVFGLNKGVVPADDMAWGDVKSLFR